MKEDFHSTKVFKYDSCTLIMYQGKNNKKVLVISTMHPAVTIDDDKKLLPKQWHFIIPQNLESILSINWLVITL